MKIMNDKMKWLAGWEVWVISLNDHVAQNEIHWEKILMSEQTFPCIIEIGHVFFSSKKKKDEGNVNRKAGRR